LSVTGVEIIYLAFRQWQLIFGRPNSKAYSPPEPRVKSAILRDDEISGSERTRVNGVARLQLNKAGNFPADAKTAVKTEIRNAIKERALKRCVRSKSDNPRLLSNSRWFAWVTNPYSERQVCRCPPCFPGSDELLSMDFEKV
jgi:hypothetical protein